MSNQRPLSHADQVAQSIAQVHARVDRMNRASYLAGILDAAELEGLIVFLEAVQRDRRALRGLTPEVAAAGLAYMLPDGEF